MLALFVGCLSKVCICHYATQFDLLLKMNVYSIIWLWKINQLQTLPEKWMWNTICINICYTQTPCWDIFYISGCKWKQKETDECWEGWFCDWNICAITPLRGDKLERLVHQLLYGLIGFKWLWYEYVDPGFSYLFKGLDMWVTLCMRQHMVFVVMVWTWPHDYMKD